MQIMLTGHRPGAKLNEPNALKGMLEVLDYFKKGHKKLTVISGGADGADRLWARAAFKNRLPYHLYLPSKYYEHYGLSGQEWAMSILWYADSVKWIGGMHEEFEVAKNFQRNDAMIDAADAWVVCSKVEPEKLATHKRGGTAHAVRSMVKRDLPMIWIDSLSGEVRFP